MREKISMTPAQREVLKLLAHNDSEEFALEIKQVLTQYFQSKIDEEIDQLWKEGILDQEVLDKINEEDIHARPR